MIPRGARDALWALLLLGAVLVTIVGVATVRATPLPQTVQQPSRYGGDLNPPSVIDLGRGMYCMSFQGGNISCVYAPDWRR